jgi:hypothetical protein
LRAYTESSTWPFSISSSWSSSSAMTLRVLTREVSRRRALEVVEDADLEVIGGRQPLDQAEEQIDDRVGLALRLDHGQVGALDRCEPGACPCQPGVVAELGHHTDRPPERGRDRDVAELDDMTLADRLAERDVGLERGVDRDRPASRHERVCDRLADVTTRRGDELRLAGDATGPRARDPIPRAGLGAGHART